MLKVLLEFLPIALFFIGYKLFDLMFATWVAIAASFVQLLIVRLMSGRFEKVSVISFFSILILGGATLLLKDEIYVKWKPTAVYWLLSATLLFSQIFGTKPMLQRLGESNLSLPTRVWQLLNFSWFGFFLIMGFLNLYVVYNFDDNVWVNFKLFGTLGITILFIILQSVFMAKHLQVGEKIGTEHDRSI